MRSRNLAAAAGWPPATEGIVRVKHYEGPRSDGGSGGNIAVYFNDPDGHMVGISCCMDRAVRVARGEQHVGPPGDAALGREVTGHSELRPGECSSSGGLDHDLPRGHYVSMFL